MASLETLELTISANAASATTAIGKLTTSLINLETAIKTPLQQLTLLNAQLRILKGYSTTKIPNIAGSGRKYRTPGSPVSASEAMRLVNSASRQELLTKKGQGMMSEYMTNATGGFYNQKELAQNAMAIKKVTEEIQNAGQASNESSKKASAFSQTLSQIGKIAKTMLIRTALKAMISSFSETWSNAYQFSKNLGGEFATNIDKIKGSLKSMSTSIIQAFSPLVSIVTPIINTISGAISYLCDLLTDVLSLLGLSSDLIGASAESIDNAGSSASSAAKNVTAAFDELNVINKSSGNSGSSGSSAIFSNEITEELAKIQVAVGESLIAIGLILAFTGHIPLGVGMIAVGAAAIVKTIVNDWGKLTDDTKAEITEIMAACGAAMLAIGAILAISGANMGLGIGLMAAGALSLGTAVTLSWGLSDEVKKKISVITAACGGALLAMGAMLAFTGGSLPLGIGLMVAGAASLASSVAITWGLDTDIKNKIAIVTAACGGALLGLGAIIAFTGASYPIGIGLMVAGAASLAGSAALTWKLSDDVKAKIAEITAYVGTALMAVGAVVAFSGASLPLGIGLMVAGAATLASSVALSWDLDEKVKKKITNITTIAGASLLALGAVLAFTGANIPLGVGMMAAGGVSLASAIALNWDSLKDTIVNTFNTIKEKISAAWNSIKDAIGKAWDKYMSWTGVSWSDISSAWNSIKTNLSNAWDTVKTSVSNAWTKASSWFSAKWGDLGTAWDRIKQGLVEKWDGIKSKVSDAWNIFLKWKNEKWANIGAAWDNIKTGLVNKWTYIRNGVANAWNIFIKWKNEKWANIGPAWDNIKTGLVNKWTLIRNGVANAWNIFIKWKNERWGNIGIAWDNIKKGLVNKWTEIRNGVANAWNIFIKWKNERWANIGSAWDNIKTGLVNKWTLIRNGVANAWNVFIKWKNERWTNIGTAWDNIKTGLVNKWTNIYNSVASAWNVFVKWKNERWANIGTAWDNIKTGLVNKWTYIYNSVVKAWNIVVKWKNERWEDLQTAWNNIKDGLVGVWDDIKSGVSGAWDAVSDWWDTSTSGMVEKIKDAWDGISSWFATNITDPISDAWTSIKTTVKDVINSIIKALNSVGNFTIPEISYTVPSGTISNLLGIGGKKFTLMSQKSISLWSIPELATGAYDIQKGQLFIANEAGAEMVGSMDGKTTVANQEQIIEGIRRGVHDANAEQNALLMEQNQLLRGILRKEWGVKASSAFGRTVSQSLDMYSALVEG